MIPAVDYLKNFIRIILPSTTVLLLIFLSALPLGIPYFSSVTPFFALIAVYFWSIYRSEIFPIWIVFVLGLIQDLILGTPLGITALILILVRSLSVSQRRFLLGQSFIVEWAGFILVALGASFLAWAIGSAYRAVFLWSEPFMIQLALTGTLYPIFSWLLAKSSRLTPRMQQG